jgi:hypothetical protein
MENNFLSVCDERRVVGTERKRAGALGQSISPVFASPIGHHHKKFVNDTTHNISRVITQLSDRLLLYSKWESLSFDLWCNPYKFEAGSFCARACKHISKEHGWFKKSVS